MFSCDIRLIDVKSRQLGMDMVLGKCVRRSRHGPVESFRRNGLMQRYGQKLK